MRATSPTRRRSGRVAALATVIVVIASLGSVASAVLVGSGNLGGFESDGNFDSNGGLDWASIAPTVVTDDTLDSGFQGSSKEEEPDAWTCNTGGANPGKGNILKAFVNPRMTATEAWLDLGYTRQDGTGDAHVNFEFNHNGLAAGSDCEIDREVNDFLVTYDFSGGNSPAEIRVWRWDGAHWVELMISVSDAKGATNLAVVTDPSGATIQVREFGEGTLDLLSSAIPSGFVGCPGFGFANIRSRSSHSITSALQDRLPTTPVDLNTCGKIIVHKVDDHDPAQPLAGAQFGLYQNANATGVPVQQQASAADGSATFEDLEPGTYWVKELSAPAGYSVDEAIRGPITIGFKQTVDITAPFVNPRDTGTIRIVKQLRDSSGDRVTPDDASDLDGAAFLVFKDANGDGNYDAGEAAKLWPSETDDAECTVSGGDGHCDVGPLPTGTYGAHETAAPAGTTPSGDVFPVTISTKNQLVTVNYVNTLSPLDITIDKSGPERAHVGDEIHYTFAVTTNGPKLHDVVVEELATDRCDGAISGPATVGNGNTFLEAGETWTYGCDHVVTAGDPDPLPNEAKVTGTDDFGRDVSDTDSHSVDILKPAITLDKKVEGGDHKPVGDAFVAHAGDVLDYTVTITNSGDAPLTISALTDSVKASLPASCTAGIGSSLAVGGTITCAYSSAAAADVHNVASVTGVDVLGGSAGTKSASDETFVDVINPSIEITKTGTVTAHEGDATSYSFAVHNNGDVALAGVSVDDDKLGHIGDIPSLAVNQTVTLTAASVAPANDLVNVATACGDDPLDEEVCDDDDHELDVIHPEIEIVKTGTASAHEGDATSYSFAVKNTGDVALTDVSVDDDVLGHIGDIPSLAVNQTVTLFKASTAPASDVRNVATACGDDPLDEEVCDDDDHELDVIHPGIDVEKSGEAKAHEGDPVTYTFEVTNTGDVALAPVTVVDDIMGTVGTIASLAVGASEELSKTYTVPSPANAVDNIVTACGGSPVAATQFCDTDEHHLEVIHPDLTIDKKVNGGDHKPIGDALASHEGEVLDYTVVINNTGDTALEITELEDSEKADFGDSCSSDVGDILAVGDVITCTYTSAATDDAHNVASVEGSDELGGAKGTVSGEDETFVDVKHPAIEVVKDGPALAHSGDVIRYTFKVTNTGDVDLSDVVVTDDVIGNIGTVSALAVGASTTLSKDYEVPADVDGVQNVATACGTDPSGVEVCDEDPHTALVIKPAIEIVKSANPTSAEPGQDVTYTYEVTNIGNTELTDILVTDDELGDIGTIDSLLPGESETLTRTVTIAADSPRTNIGTACGSDALGLEVCDTEDETISIVLPLPPSPRLPATGFRMLMWIAISTLLIAAGLQMVRTQRDRLMGRRVID